MGRKLFLNKKFFVFYHDRPARDDDIRIMVQKSLMLFRFSSSIDTTWYIYCRLNHTLYLLLCVRFLD